MLRVPALQPGGGGGARGAAAARPAAGSASTDAVRSSRSPSLSQSQAGSAQSRHGSRDSHMPHAHAYLGMPGASTLPSRSPELTQRMPLPTESTGPLPGHPRAAACTGAATLQPSRAQQAAEQPAKAEQPCAVGRGAACSFLHTQSASSPNGHRHVAVSHQAHAQAQLRQQQLSSQAQRQASVASTLHSYESVEVKSTSFAHPSTCVTPRTTTAGNRYGGTTTTTTTHTTAVPSPSTHSTTTSYAPSPQVGPRSMRGFLQSQVPSKRSSSLPTERRFY